MASTQAQSLSKEAQDIQARVEEALRQNGSASITDVVWLMLAFAKSNAHMAAVLDQLCTPVNKARWQVTFWDELTKWGARAIIALVLYWVWAAIQGGWTP